MPRIGLQVKGKIREIARNHAANDKVIDCDSDTAKKLARELAMSSGRRAILTRVRPQSWKVYVVDGDTRRKSLLWTDLSKREVLMRWRLWDEKGTRAILIAEPNWFRRQHDQANG